MLTAYPYGSGRVSRDILQPVNWLKSMPTGNTVTIIPTLHLTRAFPICLLEPTYGSGAGLLAPSLSFL